MNETRIKTADVVPGNTVPDTAADVWLIDVSGSMTGRRRRMLEESLAYYRDKVRRACMRPRSFAFNSTLREIADPAQLPESGGGTGLHLALERAAELSAGQVTVFTDGEPSDAEACFAAVRRIPGVVSCIFCGDSEDSEGHAFCRKLSRLGGGAMASRDLARGQSMICGEVDAILGLPAPRVM